MIHKEERASKVVWSAFNTHSIMKLVKRKNNIQESLS